MRRQQLTAAQQVLVERVGRSLPEDRNTRIVQRRTGRKVSEILMEFAGPWLDQVETEDQRRKVIGMAVLAWNLARFPDSELRENKDHKVAEKLGEAAMGLLNDMLARKRAFYAEEKRIILDFEITAGLDKMRVDVVTSLTPEEIADFKRNERNSGAAT